MFRFIADISIWLVLWIASWKMYYGFMMKRGVNYVDRFPVASFYFLLLSISVGLVFRDRLSALVRDFTATPFVVLIFVLVLHIVLYHLARKHLRKPIELIEKYPNEFFLRLDYRYLVSKTFEVLFQQVMIVLLVLTISQQTASMINVIGIYAALFALGHLPLFGLFGPQGKSFGVLYAVLSLISAVIFPPIILTVKYGFVYTYTIHSIFYTLLAMWFWTRHTLRGNQ